jgi:hypothetical protein
LPSAIESPTGQTTQRDIARVKEALARRKRLAPAAPEPEPHLERPATPALPLE